MKRYPIIIILFIISFILGGMLAVSAWSSGAISAQSPETISLLTGTNPQSRLSGGTCDGALTIDSVDPYDAAKAIDLCDSSVLTATWVMANGDPAVNDPDYDLGHGILPAFGTNVTVQNGAKMLALSSGTARQPSDPGYLPVSPGFDKGYLGNHPPAFPLAPLNCGGACPTTNTPHDDAALELSLQVPANADGYLFNYKFYTTDYPALTCSAFNDLFITLVDPPPAGSIFGNVVLDSQGEPITVNSDESIQVCGSPQDCYSCALGSSELLDTGFEGHGATPWQTVAVQAAPGSIIRIRFAIYDSGDGTFDATVLIDNFRWSYIDFESYIPVALSQSQ